MSRTHWHPVETAPTGRAVWVDLKWNTGRYERIATHIAGDVKDPRQWDFDSRQVNMSLINRLGPTSRFGEHHTMRILAWRELDHAQQEDPANLGRKRRTPEQQEAEQFKTTLF